MIEVLVVISILGIFAAAILIALNTATIGGKDAKIRAEMNNLIKRAALEESRNSSYDSVCGSNSSTVSPGIRKIVDSVEDTADDSIVCHSDISAYAISVVLSEGYWCIDSSGTGKHVTTGLDPLVPTFVCPN
jgi:type II secretory pathway pseudopilin PulG